MIKILQSIAALTLAIFTSAAHAATSPIYTESQTSITLTPNQTEFTLKLKSNPTTGYSWSLENYSAAFITPVKHFYQPPTRQLIGSGGYEFWTFHTKPAAFEKPQSISMLYARPWEKKKTGTEIVFKIMKSQ